MTVAKPPITYVGTNGNNIWAGRGVHPKQIIVLHVMEGTLAGCDSWFASPQAQASANYGIGKDGTIHCYVDPFGPDAPFANGLVNHPDATVRQFLAVHPTPNLNYVSVSIEHEGKSGEPLTDPQLQASARLTAWLCEQNGIAFSEDTVWGHYEIDSITRAHCPGWDRAGWLRYEAAVASFLTPQPAPDPLAELKAQLAAAVGERDKLVALLAQIHSLSA